MNKIGLGIIICCIFLYFKQEPIEFIGGVVILYLVYLFLIKPHQTTDEEEREAQNRLQEKIAKSEGYEIEHPEEYLKEYDDNDDEEEYQEYR